MRRLVLIGLLLLLPLQFVWAAAAPYCRHEATSEMSQHFGHHEHQHKAGKPAAPAANGDGPAAYDLDCTACHFGTAASLLAPFIDLPAPAHDTVHCDHVPVFRSHIPSGPERPDRAPAPAAARFGSGVRSASLPA